MNRGLAFVYDLNERVGLGKLCRRKCSSSVVLETLKGGGGGGGCNPKKNRLLPQISNLGLVFSVFFGFSILANFDWFNWSLLSGSCWL